MKLLHCTLLLLLVSLATAGSAQVNFNYTYYAMPNQGLATASADFNRDGIPIEIGHHQILIAARIRSRNDHGAAEGLVEYPVGQWLSRTSGTCAG